MQRICDLLECCRETSVPFKERTHHPFYPFCIDTIGYYFFCLLVQGVSSVTGQGMDQVLAAIKEAVVEFNTEYKEGLYHLLFW